MHSPRFYDLTSELLFVGGRRRAYRSLATAAGVKRRDRVLDVGCGTGYFARLLAEAVGPEGSVVGIDAGRETVEYARRRARRLPGCRFEVAAAASLPFDAGSFDVVVSSLMLHHLPDEERLVAAREMKRVLRPGGTLLLAEFGTPPTRGIHGLLASIHGVAEMHHRVPPSEPLLREAGFAELRAGSVPPWLEYVRATNA